jgi:hypothetical protein
MNRALIHELATGRFIAQREDALFLRPLPHTDAEDLLEIVMRRYERASTLLTSNRPVADWGKLLGDTAAVTALLDQLIQSRDIRQRCSRWPRRWRSCPGSDGLIDPTPCPDRPRIRTRSKRSCGSVVLTVVRRRRLGGARCGTARARRGDCRGGASPQRERRVAPRFVDEIGKRGIGRRRRRARRAAHAIGRLARARQSKRREVERAGIVRMGLVRRCPGDYRARNRVGAAKGVVGGGGGRSWRRRRASRRAGEGGCE